MVDGANQEGSQLCSVCDDGASHHAIARCLDCNLHLCSKAHAVHRRFDALGEHTLVSLNGDALASDSIQAKAALAERALNARLAREAKRTTHANNTRTARMVRAKVLKGDAEDGESRDNAGDSAGSSPKKDLLGAEAWTRADAKSKL